MESIREMQRPGSPRISCASPDYPCRETAAFMLNGELGYSLHRALERIETQLPYSQEYILGQISAEQEIWSNFPRVHGDIAGRWILAETAAYSSAADPPTPLKRIVDKALALQNDDGSFGAVSHAENPLNMHKLYGNGWMLRGLAQYAVSFETLYAMRAALKLGDYYLAVFDDWAGFDLPEGDTGFYAITRSCYFHAFDGLVALFRISGERKYLELAGRFIEHLTPLEESDHSHMYLTIRRGMIEYYAETGMGEKLKALADEMRRVWDQYILESGGVPERFRTEEGETSFDEGCSLFDWQLAALRLHQLTDDVFWLEVALLNLENHIFYNQCYNGGFGSFEIYHDYLQYGKEAPWCCSLFGPWGLIKSGSFFVEKRAEELRVNHLVSGCWEFEDGSAVELERDDESQRFILSVKGQGIERLSLFAPHWLELDHPRGERKGNRIEIHLESERIEISFKYRLWTAKPGRSPRRVEPRHGELVNLFYGPYLLTHRIHTPPTVQLNAPYRVEWLHGLGPYGEGYRVILASDSIKNPNDVFLGVREVPGDLYCYAVKDKENTDRNVSRIRVG